MVVGQGEDALRVYKKALKVDPNSLGALVALANLHVLQGDVKTAKTMSAKAMKLEPRLADPYKVQALIAASKKDFATAERILKNGIQKTENVGKLDLRGVLATVYANQQKLDQAIGQFEAILAKAPNVQGVRIPLCQLYRKKKRKSGKAVCLEACKEVGIARKECAVP